MNPFLRHLSLLLVLVVLAGCGRRAVPNGHPYRVILSEGIIEAPIPPSTTRRSSGGSWSCSGNIGGSGKDVLVVVAVIIAVALVVVVVSTAIDAATPDPVNARYHLTLSGELVPLEVVVIGDNNRIYLEPQQYDALMAGAYNRAEIRPAFWEGTNAAPTQIVGVTVAKDRITITPIPQLNQP